MRATRLLRLLHLLAARGRLPASRLAELLEVSVRTIYRDADALSAAGFPVYAEHGPEGGYELLAEFSSPFVVLTAEEIALLVRLGPPPSGGALGVDGELQHAYNKLVVALSRASAAQYRQLVLVDAPRWFHATPTPPLLEVLTEATTRAQRLVVQRAGHEPCPLDPLGLVNKAGRWYVVGVDPTGAQRIHRVDRLERAEPSGEAFTPPAGFDLATAWAAWVEDFEASRPVVDAVIDVERDAGAELPKALGEHVAPLLAAARPRRDGRRRITVRFLSPEAAVHQLTGAGHLATVVSPDWLHDAVRERAQRILAGAAAMEEHR